MTSLQETLSALSTALPEVPGQTGVLVQEGHALENAANHLLEHISKVEDQAEDLLGRCRHALAEVESQAEGRHAELESTSDALQGTVEEGVRRLDALQGEVSQVGDAVGNALAALHSAASQAVARTRTGVGECQESLVHMDDALQNGQHELGADADSVASEAHVLQQAVRQATATIDQALAALRGEMKSLLEHARQEVHGAEQMLRASLAAQESHLQEEGSRLNQGTSDLLEEVRTTVEHELKGRVAAATEKAVAALASLARGGLAIREGTASGREVLEAGFQAITEAMDPLPDAVEAVKHSAREVGLQWPGAGS